MSPQSPSKKFKIKTATDLNFITINQTRNNTNNTEEEE